MSTHRASSVPPSLKHYALSHKIGNIPLHIIPSINLLEIMIHLHRTRMNSIMKLMSFVQNSFSQPINLGNIKSTLVPQDTITTDLKNHHLLPTSFLICIKIGSSICFSVTSAPRDDFATSWTIKPPSLESMRQTLRLAKWWISFTKPHFSSSNWEKTPMETC